MTDDSRLDTDASESCDAGYRVLQYPRPWQWLLAVYWLAMFTATHVPKDFPGVPSGHWDKLAHFGAYTILAMLFAITWQVAAGALVDTHFRFAWLLLFALGAIDELTQPFVGREASWLDWIADGTGAAVGLAAFWWLSRWRESRERASEIDRDASGT